MTFAEDLGGAWNLRVVPRSPQEAALVTLACRDAGAPDRVDPRWLARILTQQRPDGSWPAEPFAPAPNRGGWVSWYSSSTLTTALCHSALTSHSALNGPLNRNRVVEIVPRSRDGM